MKPRTRALLLPALALLAIPAPSEAARMVILQFEGAGPAGSARMSLVRPLINAQDVTLMPQREYVSQVQAQGIAPGDMATPEGVRRGAEITGVNAVIAGRTIRKNNQWHVRLSYFDSDGTRRLHRDYPIVQGRFRPNDRNRILRYVRERTNLIASQTQAVARDEQPRAREEPPSFAPSRETRGLAPEPPAPRATPSLDPLVSAPPRHTPPEPSAREPSSAWTPVSDRDRPAKERSPAQSTTRPLLSVLLVGGGGNRSYSMEGRYSSISYQTSKPFSGGGIALFPEVGVLVESFPVRDDTSLASGLGLAAGYSRGFIRTHYRSGDLSGEIDTPVQRIHVDGRFLVRLMEDSPFGPELGLRAGIGYNGFDASAAEVPFTTVNGLTIRAGVEAIQPLVPSLLWLDGSIYGIPAGSPGRFETEAFGDTASALGWGARAGLSGALGLAGGSVRWGAWIDRQWVRTTFEGVGTRDDGGTSEESYLSFQGGVGWAF